jgi:hypothetical protein
MNSPAGAELSALKRDKLARESARHLGIAAMPKEWQRWLRRALPKEKWE